MKKYTHNYTQTYAHTCTDNGCTQTHQSKHILRDTHTHATHINSCTNILKTYTHNYTYAYVHTCIDTLHLHKHVRANTCKHRLPFPLSPTDRYVHPNAHSRGSGTHTFAGPTHCHTRILFSLLLLLSPSFLFSLLLLHLLFSLLLSASLHRATLDSQVGVCVCVCL